MPSRRRTHSLICGSQISKHTNLFLPEALPHTLTLEAIFAVGWLLTAIFLREERPACLCLFAYNLLESAAIYFAGLVPEPGGGISRWALCTAMLSVGVVSLGSDFYFNGKPLYLWLWTAVTAFGAAIQILAPVVPLPDLSRALGYVVCQLALITIPLALFWRPTLKEFGKLGLFAYIPFLLIAAFEIERATSFIVNPASVKAYLHADRTTDSRWLLPVLVTTGIFHLVWLAMVFGRQVLQSRRLARYDALTGLLLRPAFERELAQTLAFARRNGHGVVVAFLDIDHFKRINDLGGHAAGDRVLQQIAWLLRKGVRASDYVGRWGGDEFVLVLQQTTAEGAHAFLVRLQQDIQANAIVVPKGCAPVTLSIGFCTCKDGEDDPDALIARADAAMYEAKRRGRNTVVGG